MARVKAVGRLVYLDVFKTLLVYGMIGAHVMELLGSGLESWTHDFVDFINLISFSGFMLAFGIGTGLQRKDGRRGSFIARLRPVLVMAGAVYISSIGFVVLVEEKRLGIGLLLDLLSMRVLFGGGAFLASFLVLYIALALARPLFLKLGESLLLVALVGAACLAATLLVYDGAYPLAGAVIGTTRFSSFPLVPYLPWFLIGVYLGRRGAVSNLWLLAPSIVATGIFVSALMTGGALPQRFPPSALWVAGSALPLMMYLFVSNLVGSRMAVPDVLTLPGRHVLRFVVLSNLAIFAARHVLGRPVEDWPMILVATLAIIGAITLISLALERFLGGSTPARRRR